MTRGSELASHGGDPAARQRIVFVLAGEAVKREILFGGFGERRYFGPLRFIEFGACAVKKDRFWIRVARYSLNLQILRGHWYCSGNIMRHANTRRKIGPG